MKLFQVDAFTSELFKGNPAAVCPLNSWMPEILMQNIAAENNLAETAFFIPEGKDYHIRWFTPMAEVDLCGHATLAAAHVLFEHLDYQNDRINFQSKSGPLSVSKSGETLTLDFPSDPFKEIEMPGDLKNAFDKLPETVLKGTLDYVFIYENENDIVSITPRMDIISKAKSRGIIISSPGKSADFVSRYFAPQFGIPEDPVTGSAHTVLTPYWASKFGKTHLSAKQLSQRSGELNCSLKDSRVLISGKAKTYLIGDIILD